MRVVHPVPLAVHDVVADLHVLEDLGRRQGRGAADGKRAEARQQQADAADHGEPPLHLDHRLDVAAVAFAELTGDAVFDRVELARQLLELRRREVRQRALLTCVDGAGIGRWGDGGAHLVGLLSVGVCFPADAS